MSHNSPHNFAEILERDSADLATQSGVVSSLPHVMDRRAAHALIERVYDDYQRDVRPEMDRLAETPRDITVLPGERLRIVHGPRIPPPEADHPSDEECAWCDFGCDRCKPLDLMRSL